MPRVYRAANRIKHWVLRNKNGRYFEAMAEIGPRATRDKGKAVKFRSQQDAMKSPAYSFALESYVPLAVRYR